MQRLWPWVVAILLFLGVGYFVADNQWGVLLHNAEGSRDACYMAKGYPANRSDFSGSIPPAIVEECTQPMVRYQATMMPWLIGAGAGAIAALIALAAILGLRRSRRREDAV